MVTVLAALLIEQFIPALHGSPRTVTGCAWLLVVVATWVDFGISYRRRRARVG